MAAGTASMADEARLRGLRLAIAGLGLGAVLLVGVSAWLVFRPGGPLVDAPLEIARIGGPFDLVDQTGARISDRDLSGQPFAVFFGFTHCPEVCPTTLWEMSEALKQLGPDGDRMKVLFISVDPARDTPELLAGYLQSFDRRIVGLTGTEAEIAAVGAAYRAYWRKVATDDGGYTIDHTASVYLMDASGGFVGTIAYGEDQAVRLEKLKNLLRG